MSPELSAILKVLILPPGINLVVILLGWLLLRKYKRFVLLVTIFSLLTLYMFSMPIFARTLAEMIEPDRPLDAIPPQNKSGKAIVILGCGRYANPPEYPTDDISACALIRLRYAAEIHPKLQLPVLISGGSVFAEAVPESRIMNDIFEHHFGIKSMWLETRSRNTVENARYSAIILRKQKIDTIYLVTHALHMQRSRQLFEQQGLHVIPAPTYFYSSPGYAPPWLDYLPSPAAMLTSNMVLKEYLGITWCRVTSILFPSAT